MWAFLDLPEEGFEPAVEYWRSVTESTLSAWRGEGQQFATFLPAQGDPWVKVQRVGGGDGVHLDLDVEGPLEDARDEARGLGAEVLAEVPDDDGMLGVVVCRSPGGFVFCLTRWHPEEIAAGQVRVGVPSLLDQVCLDVPPAAYAGELAFWATLTGWQVRQGGLPEFASLGRPDGIPVRLLFQRLGTDPGTVTGHVDFACADRSSQVARHLAQGAVVEAVNPHWTVLVDPSGRRYCLTDRDPATGVLA